MTDPAIQSLLASDCPSIVYRTRQELLAESPADPGLTAIHERILQDGLVREVLAWQQPDGWLAEHFHGTRSIEAGIRILCEKGVQPAHPTLARALSALEAGDERLRLGIGRVGRILDDQGLGGSEMIRAAVLARAGREQPATVQKQVTEALAGFRAVLEIGSIDDLAEARQDKLVFRPGRRWPSIYHLRLLAFTSQWRNAEALSMLARSLERLAALSPLPPIHARHGSQIIAPASFAMDDFTPQLSALDDFGWMAWFQRTELLARLGLVDRVPALQSQVIQLSDMLAGGNGMFTRKVNHPYFMKWGAYTGLALQPDWRTSHRRIEDLTFRSRLILHYYENSRQGETQPTRIRIS
jgi:hypothetical protein